MGVKFVNHIFNRQLLSKRYKKYFQINNKRMNASGKKWAEDMITDISPEKTNN